MMDDTKEAQLAQIATAFLSNSGLAPEVHAKKAQTLTDLLIEIFSGGNKDIESKLDKILANQEAAKADSAKILDGQKVILAAVAALAEFLGTSVPGVGATPEQLDALGLKLKAEVARVRQFDKDNFPQT